MGIGIRSAAQKARRTCSYAAQDGAALAFLATENELTWEGAAGAPLAGTLTLPASGGRAPALLLIQGSGPTDRDGNQRPHLVTDLLKDLAHLLAGFGIASLRCDKRGMGAVAASLPKAEPDLAVFVGWDRFVGDAQRSLAMLAGQPGVDRARVGILGHSEGGLIALDLAAGGLAHPAMLILAATTGRPIAAVLRDQIARLARQQGAPETAVVAILAENDRILARLVAGEGYPEAIHPGLAALYPPYLRHYWEGFASRDPADLAGRCPCPILVLSGSADVQVLADRDVPALEAALIRRAAERGRPYRVALLAGASHNLKPVSGLDDPGLSGPLHSDVASSLGTWFRDQGWA